MSSELTKRQQQILDFIRQTQERTGSAPTRREIATHFGFQSETTVADHLRLIRKKGFLAPHNRKARSLRVLSPLARFLARIAEIPLLGAIPAGKPDDRFEAAEGCVRVDVDSIGFKPNGRTFALRVSGDSMIGRHILDGDIVVLEHGPEPRDGQIVAALIDGRCTLKTFCLRNRNAFLKAENPKYPALVPAEELMIQGVFRALIRKTKDA